MQWLVKYSWIVLLLGESIVVKSQDKSFDAFVSSAIELSDQSLYSVQFDQALDFLDEAYFEQFEQFNEAHAMRLVIQRRRVLGFQNLLQQNRSDRVADLDLLLSFRNVADTMTAGTTLANYYLALSSSYRSNGIPDSSEYYEVKSMDLYADLNRLDKVAEIRANRISRKHNALLRQGKRTEIMEMISVYQEEIDFSSKHSKYAMAYNTRHLAQIHRRQTGNYERALALFQESLELRKSIGFQPFIPASISSLGDVYLLMEEYDQAINAYETSAEMAERIGFVRYQLFPYMQIGEICLMQKNQEKAKTAFTKALINASKNQNESGIEAAKKKLESF